MSGLAGHFCITNIKRIQNYLLITLFYCIHMGYHIKQFA